MIKITVVRIYVSNIESSVAEKEKYQPEYYKVLFKPEVQDMRIYMFCFLGYKFSLRQSKTDSLYLNHAKLLIMIKKKLGAC